MKRYIKLYIIFFKNSLIRMMENRFDFIFRAFPTMGTVILGLLGINFLFNSINEIAGWSKSELFLLLGIYNIIWGIFFGLFIQNMARVNRQINKGDLDLLLTKPLNTQFYISVRHPIDFGESATVVVGLILVIYSVGQLGLDMSLLKIIMLVVLVLNSVIICYSMWFINVTTSFWVGRISELHEGFISLYSLNRYPTSIFQGWIKVAFTYVLPFAFIVTVPAELVLGTAKIEIAALAILAGLFSITASSLFWNFALKRYSSASS